MNTIVTKIVLLLIPLVLTACSSGPPSSGPRPVLPPLPTSDDASVDQDESILSEVDARTLLNQLFRSEGLRIVNDVPFGPSEDIEVTLDGFDPERGIGFEYIAPREVGTDLSPEELAALGKLTEILVVSAMSAERLQQEAQVFLKKAHSGAK